MPRKGPVPPREVMPDPIYGDVLVAKLINKVMKDGKKSVAEYIVYTALEEASREAKMTPTELFHKVIEQLKPEYEVRPRRVGGATYQVPVEVPPRRQISLAI
ncbi:MAG: 30S ribosomal protein S7, partial [Hydrogenobacter thermophilus]|nr:30S ribosomal protein S7 [Hydrogenobacter thermophilus]